MGQEITFQYNSIALNENKFGLLDYNTYELKFLEYTGMPYDFKKPLGDDPYNDESVHTEMLYYCNMYLEHENRYNERDIYNFLQLIGEVGGTQSAISCAFMWFFGIYTYKLHESVVY